VKSTLAVDEVARRESIEATDEDVDQEIEKFDARAGRTPAAVRARLEKRTAPWTVSAPGFAAKKQ
jgi:FKBP-type peptidyl-prolyl cis-trans isomerase (trigger factor)